MSEAHTTVWENIRRATAFLQSRGVSEAFASARVLMAAALDTSSADVVVSRAKPMTREESERFWELIERRASGEPVAYILGRCEFYSIEL
ncbi:MAG TPA: peptide chain release factor N(5)-glutamine methyltransferase, partial [Proteobacteria bacterium]|nr:peptide chain release factor N(5)-glutamine methyltransferase [Pseudomonadota bacterium]